MEIQLGPKRLQIIGYLDQMLEAAPQTINTPHGDEIEFTPNRIFQKCIESRTITTGFCTADPIVCIFADDFPIASLSDSKKFMALIIGGLRGCADSGVDCDAILGNHWISLSC